MSKVPTYLVHAKRERKLQLIEHLTRGEVPPAGDSIYLTLTRGGGDHCPHFEEEDTEARRWCFSQVSSPRRRRATIQTQSCSTPIFLSFADHPLSTGWTGFQWTSDSIQGFVSLALLHWLHNTPKNLINAKKSYKVHKFSCEESIRRALGSWQLPVLIEMPTCRDTCFSFWHTGHPPYTEGKLSSQTELVLWTI